MLEQAACDAAGTKPVLVVVRRDCGEGVVARTMEAFEVACTARTFGVGLRPAPSSFYGSAVASNTTFITLAEHASAGVDGTFTLLRAGMDHVWNETEPMGFVATLFMSVGRKVLVAGTQNIEIVLEGPGGAKSTLLAEKMDVASAEGVTNLVVPMALAFPTAGTYILHVTIGVAKAEYTVEATKGSPPPYAKKT